MAEKQEKGKGEPNRKKVNTKKALVLVKEISQYLDKMLVNNEVTKPLPTKSTQLKPFKK